MYLESCDSRRSLGGKFRVDGFSVLDCCQRAAVLIELYFLTIYCTIQMCFSYETSYRSA